MYENLLIEQFLSLEIQLNYKNGFGRKFQLGNQLTLGSMAQATLIYSKIHIIFTQHWLFVVSPSIQRTQIIVILHIMEQLNGRPILPCVPSLGELQSQKYRSRSRISLPQPVPYYGRNRLPFLAPHELGRTGCQKGHIQPLPTVKHM